MLLIVVLLPASVLPFAAGAYAATGVSGKYGCSPGAGATLLPTNAGLTLKSTGRYSLALYGVGGGKSSGTYKKNGKKLKFSSGVLGGKTGTFRSGGSLPGVKAQISFSTWINGGGREVCRR
jgi:hypothetical protein